MSATEDDKTPAAPQVDAGKKAGQDSGEGAASPAPTTPEAGHGAGGDPLIEGP